MDFVTITQFTELMSWDLHIGAGQSLIYWDQTKMANIFKQQFQAYF